MTSLAPQIDAVSAAMPFRVVGRVEGIAGLALEATDLVVPVGSLCRITSFGGQTCLAEVIGFRGQITLLMPLSSTAGVGSRQEAETQIMIAVRLGYIDDHEAAPVLELAMEVGRIIAGLQRSLTYSRASLATGN